MDQSDGSRVLPILRGWCAESGIDFEVVEETRVDGRLISSSLIRQCLGEGRVGLIAGLSAIDH